jgi:pimeloyl-ACP methyl ester carboxylesterase
MKRLGVFVAVTIAVLGTWVAPAAAQPEAGITWGQCRTYTDDELKSELRGHLLADFKRQISRRQCGFVSVPLDYGKPNGRQVKIAVTRYAATGKRVGVLATNPGGPGQSGVLLPADISLGEAGGLAERFDLIGFDPRGVGDSVPRLVCNEAPGGAFSTDKEANRKVADDLAAVNRKCAASDPALTASLTVTTVARDLDRIRAALGEERISYLGISWGTALGAAYQAQYPKRVQRMVLDSVVDPGLRLDRGDDGQAAARERDAKRLVEFLARNDTKFHLGRTGADVTATLLRLRNFYAENPQESIPGVDGIVDEFTVAFTLGQNSREWPNVAGQLAAMRKFTDSFRPSGVSVRSTSPRAAEFFNGPTNIAVNCNADTGVRDFDTWFDRWDANRKKFPLTGLVSNPVPLCTGWPAAQPEYFANTGTDVLLVGHEFEFVTPIGEQRAMLAKIGGSSLVVEDDVHGALIDVPCAGEAVSFLVSAKRPPARCAGVPVP